MTVYMSDDDEKGKENVLLRSIDKDTTLVWESFDEKQHFTQPPAHYTEASLVKTLEELGIGRPSTYAPTITTILARRYVVKENKNLYVTELGEVVNDMMKEALPIRLSARYMIRYIKVQAHTALQVYRRLKRERCQRLTAEFCL